MKYFYSTLIAVTLSTSLMAKENAEDAADEYLELKDVVIIESSNQVTTLQDIVTSMGIKPEHFRTQYALPTEEERQDLKMRSYPIVVWENPQTISNPNPPANRNGKE